ncbi:MAG TPA: low temperature requirement protein A [Novosphingobium sp.]|nr:low temperature requirement protein A [Novosphingobium sp.]
MPEARPAGVGAALAAVHRRATALAREYEGGRAAVSNLELFFDLVFAFAITQLSHALLVDLTFTGALRTAVLFFAVWWAWIYTTWVTNWIDPERGANRIAIGVVMGLSLAMGCAIPTAYGAGGKAFVGAYLAVQIGRSFYSSYAMGEWRQFGRGGGSHNLLRISLWFVASAPLWLAGLATPDADARTAWWIAALAVEYAGPMARFPVPGLGRSTASDWIIAGNHMAERCALFIIIALGEGLLITGATFAGAQGTRGLTAAFLNAFLGSFAMWWIYFDLGARRGAEHIESHDNPGLVARQAFTYGHIPIVAGIIVLAVLDELALEHPLEPSAPAYVAVLGGGMALFVWGNMAFKKVTSGRPWYPLSHAVGLWLAALIAVWGLVDQPPRLALAAASTAALTTIALWEWGSFHGGWIERMEARGWRLGTVLRQRSDRLRARREAKTAARG